MIRINGRSPGVSKPPANCPPTIGAAAKPISIGPMICDKLEDVALGLRATSTREHDIAIFTANYGRLPENHVTVQYLKSLAGRDNAGLQREIIVLPNYPEANAFVTRDNRTIFLTQKLLNKLDCQEALVWILSHEEVHIEEEHIKQTEKETDIIRRQGLVRVHEGRADFLGAYRCDQKENNPLGAVAALEALDPKAESADPFYGASLDRSLNMLLTIPYMDFPHLSHHLTPLPSYIKNTGIKPPLSERVKKAPFNDIEPTIKAANVYQLRVMLEEIKRQLILEENDLKNKELERREECLMRRAYDLIKRELRSRKMDDCRAAVCLGFYEYLLDLSTGDFNLDLKILKIKDALKARARDRRKKVFLKEEMAWLAENFVEVFLSGTMGFEPLNEKNAREYCGRFAKLCLRILTEKDYVDLNHKAVRVVQGKLSETSVFFGSDPMVSVAILDDCESFDVYKFYKALNSSDFDVSASLSREVRIVLEGKEEGEQKTRAFIDVFAGRVRNLLDKYLDGFPEKVKEIWRRILLHDYDSAVKINIARLSLEEMRQFKEGLVRLGFSQGIWYELPNIIMELIPKFQRFDLIDTSLSNKEISDISRINFMAGLKKADLEQREKIRIALEVGGTTRYYLREPLAQRESDNKSVPVFDIEDLIVFEDICSEEIINGATKGDCKELYQRRLSQASKSNSDPPKRPGI